jgi:hypothetical protein
MTEHINPTDFAHNLYALLEETFETHHGIYLDKNTSLFQTLEEVTAAQASLPVGATCASLAAQVAHIIFYIETLERYVFVGDTSPVDWGAIWRTVEKVTPEEWDALRAQLKQSYGRLSAALHTHQVWNENAIGGALAIVVHSAYHLGEIRQALCTLR